MPKAPKSALHEAFDLVRVDRSARTTRTLVLGASLAVARVRQHKPVLPGVLLEPLTGLRLSKARVEAVVDLPARKVYCRPQLMLGVARRRHEARSPALGLGAHVA